MGEGHKESASNGVGKLHWVIGRQIHKIAVRFVAKEGQCDGILPQLTTGVPWEVRKSGQKTPGDAW